MKDCLAYAIVIQTKDKDNIKKLKAAVRDIAQLAENHVHVAEHDIEVYIDDKYDDPIE